MVEMYKSELVTVGSLHCSWRQIGVFKVPFLKISQVKCSQGKSVLFH